MFIVFQHSPNRIKQYNILWHIAKFLYIPFLSCIFPLYRFLCIARLSIKHYTIYTAFCVPSCKCLLLDRLVHYVTCVCLPGITSLLICMKLHCATANLMQISCPCVNWLIYQTGISVCVYGCLADQSAENYSWWHATSKSFIGLRTSSQLDFRPVVFQTVMWFYLPKINSRRIHILSNKEPKSHAPLASGGSVLLPVFETGNFVSLQQFAIVLV